MSTPARLAAQGPREVSRERTRLLIVDDEPNVRSVLVRHLTDEKTECVASHSAFDALNKIKSQRFSLVISDVMMPGMSGVELLRFVKKHDAETAVIMITGLMDINTAVDSLRTGACDFITKPFDLTTIGRAVERALERRQLLIENRYYQQELEKKVRERTLELNGALHEVEESYKITLEALVSALDAREHETQAHSQRVREYTLTLAQQLGLGGEELIQAGRGALLHDVGKIGVPDSILLKPDKLTPEEWVEMKKHPKIGFEILQNIKFLSTTAEIVLCHQERWDGRGYPNCLGGKDVPLGARIFAVVDTLDAMTSNRPYRRALSFEAALEEIRNCSGTQFDPEVVDAFFSVPHEMWRNIHDAVNRNHQSSDCYEVICRP
ncbi:MAG TPA: HD domain-containing phosphohydrolase [Acidobacteriota bacterium]|nr:HD domain-containing phosphohydrolase [Acidobacteriota bacterium]